MDDIWNFFRDELLPHFPFIVGYFGFVFIGQFSKVQIWSKERAAKSKFFHFMRRTLAAHAPATGLILGAIPGMPVSPGVDTIPYAMLYWGGCGMFSSWSFHALSKYIKMSTDGKLDLNAAIAESVSPSMSPDPGPEPKKPE